MTAPIHGTARLGKRTKDLVKRLGPLDVAVIDHRNLDRIAAEELVACGRAGRRQLLAVLRRQLPERRAPDPGRGPGCRWSTSTTRVSSSGSPTGTRSRSTAARVLLGGEELATGRRLEADELARELDAQRRRIDQALHDFTENTMAHIREEGELLSGAIDFPGTRTVFRDRHVLIVVRGPDHTQGPAGAARLHPGRAPGAGRAWTAAPTRSSRRG